MNGGSCDPRTGQCFCAPGWSGRDCTKRMYFPHPHPLCNLSLVDQKFVSSVLGAIFIGGTIATCDVISFFLLRWLVNSCHPLDRSDVKLKPTVCWSLTFSSAPDRLLVFVLISHWLPWYLHLFLPVVANVFWLSFIDQKLQSKLTTYRG